MFLSLPRATTLSLLNARPHSLVFSLVRCPLQSFTKWSLGNFHFWIDKSSLYIFEAFKIIYTSEWTVLLIVYRKINCNKWFFVLTNKRGDTSELYIFRWYVQRESHVETRLLSIWSTQFASLTLQLYKEVSFARGYSIPSTFERTCGSKQPSILTKSIS